MQALVWALVAGLRVPTTRMVAPSTAAAPMCFLYKAIEVATGDTSAGELVPEQEVTLHDITAELNDLVRESGVVEGTLHCVSRHTTTALTINEMESVIQPDRPPQHAPEPTSVMPSVLARAAAAGRHSQVALEFGGA